MVHPLSSVVVLPTFTHLDTVEVTEIMIEQNKFVVAIFYCNVLWLGNLYCKKLPGGQKLACGFFIFLLAVLC